MLDAYVYIGLLYVATILQLWKLQRKKLSKIPHPTVSGRISRESFKQGSRNFTYLSGSIGLINLSDMISPPASGWHLTKFEKRPKMPNMAALLALSLMQCQRRLKISRVKNIRNVSN